MATIDAQLYAAAINGNRLAHDALAAIDELQSKLHDNDARDDEIRFALLWFARGKASGDDTARRIAELMGFDLGGVTP
jgi:hypothetical protein